MLGLGIGLAWAGYALWSYGYVLAKGWNIRPGQWLNPVHPYEWPAGGPPPIPDTQLFPGGPAGAAGPNWAAEVGGAAESAAASVRAAAGRLKGK